MDKEKCLLCKSSKKLRMWFKGRVLCIDCEDFVKAILNTVIDVEVKRRLDEHLDKYYLHLKDLHNINVPERFHNK